MSDTKFAQPRKVGRASRTLGQLWQVPTFLAGVLALAVVAVSAPWRADSGGSDFDNDLNRLRAVLTPKATNLDSLVPLAETVLARLPRHAHKAAEAHLLLGVLYDRLADKLSAEKAAPLRKRALGHLEEAFKQGVADADQPQLFFRLGRILYDKAELRRAIHLLARAVDQQPLEQRHAAYAMLVQAYLKLPRPDLDAALEANQKRLDLLEDDKLLGEAWLLQGELLAKKERRLEALKTLERIGAKAPRELRVPARLLQIRCCEQEGMWNKAIAFWTELMPESVHVPGGRARILYALGACHANLDPPDYKVAEQSWQEAAALDGDDAQAANLRLGELRLFGPSPDPNAARQDLAKALEHVATPQDYQNKTFSLKQVRELFEQALDRYGTDLKSAQNLAELYQRLALPGVAEDRLARAAEELARRLSAQAEQAVKAGKSDAFKLEEQARARYRGAAQAYEQAAQVLPDEQRGQAWWRSALCYVPAKDFARAAVVLEFFIKTKASDEQLAEAYLLLAEAYREQGDVRRATEAYLCCIAIPHTPFAARALYQLAGLQIAQNRWEDAEATLNQVLRMSAGVDRDTKELSLFKLADLLVQGKDYDRARLVLEQAIQQYPRNPQVWTMREQLGDCYVKLAEGFRQKIQSNPSETQHRKNRWDYLQRACQTYQQLADDLYKAVAEAGAQGQPISASKTASLRRANLAVADVYFEMEMHEEAVRRYQKLTQDYRRQPEGFLACQHLAYGVGAMSKVVPPDQANRLWDRVRLVVGEVLGDLQGMSDNEVAFARKSRREWLETFTNIVNYLPRPALASPASPPP